LSMAELLTVALRRRLRPPLPSPDSRPSRHERGAAKASAGDSGPRPPLRIIKAGLSKWRPWLSYVDSTGKSPLDNRNERR